MILKNQLFECNLLISYNNVIIIISRKLHNFLSERDLKLAKKHIIDYDQSFEKYLFFFQLEKLKTIEIREQIKYLQKVYYANDLDSFFQ